MQNAFQNDAKLVGFFVGQTFGLHVTQAFHPVLARKFFRNIGMVNLTNLILMGFHSCGVEFVQGIVKNVYPHKTQL